MKDLINNIIIEIEKEQKDARDYLDLQAIMLMALPKIFDVQIRLERNKINPKVQKLLAQVMAKMRMWNYKLNIDFDTIKDVLRECLVLLQQALYEY